MRSGDPGLAGQSHGSRWGSSTHSAVNRTGNSLTSGSSVSVGSDSHDANSMTLSSKQRHVLKADQDGQ